MKLRRVAGDCNEGPCPTVFATDRDTFVVQGYVVDDAEALATIGLPLGETAVEVPRELLQGLGRERAG